MANELPTLETLQATYGYNDPRAYQQAQENQGLAQQFQQQNLAQEANKTQEGFLANQQSTAMNPLLVDQQRGVNTTRGITNQTSQLGLDRANALQFQNLAKDQQQAILDMKENDIKAIEQHGRQLSYSNDPNERAQGQQIYEMGQTFREAKQKHAYETEIEKQKTDSAARVAGIGAGATLGAARIGADSRQAIAELQVTAKQALASKEKTLEAYLVTLRKLPPSPERDAEMAGVRADLLTTNPAYAAGLNIEQTTGGAVTPNVPVPGQKAPPPIGTVYKGHVFVGGDPSKQTSWKAQ